MTIDELEQLRTELLQAREDFERIAVLDRNAKVQAFLAQPNHFRSFLQDLTPECECVMKQLAAIGQVIDPCVESVEKWRHLLQVSLEIDRFYREIGGIVGYQVSILRLLSSLSHDPDSIEAVQFHSPSFDDISEPTPEVVDSTQAGLKALPYVAEFYPLGGAADRLHLIDEETGFELPAAKLPFAGRPLLETLIRDLQAREWLYYRLYGRQVTAPIAIMTSHEKENHRHVLKICEERHWFGRSPEMFRFFVQPLVPTVDENGRWHTTGPLKPYLKPGGHGAIWKLARDMKVFDWLRSMGCKKALVRQINNPIAGIDYGLLAFVGIGYKRNLSFGFASCNRLIKAAEGMVVLKEKEGRVVLTNVEYCEFAKYGIEDAPLRPNEPYSRFSSNTNILFIDLDAVEKAVETHPFPGLLLNLKPACVTDDEGRKREIQLARLESTMQNIADVFEEPKTATSPIQTAATFVTYNQRHKTISVAKKAYIPGKLLLETPEQCFYELLQANRELLTLCNFALPPVRNIEEFLQKGPDALFLYHPALGPLYSVIRQKLRRGSLELGSEWIAEIAELDVEHLKIDGSLRIYANQILGPIDAQSRLHYSARVGRCILRDIVVCNQGVDWQAGTSHWKMQLRRKESLEILLQGWSEFDARGVVFEGAHRFVVKDGVRMVVRQEGRTLQISEEPMPERPLWEYTWKNGVLLN